MFVLPQTRSCFEPIHCLSRHCTTAGERQGRVERSPVGLRGLWGRVSSNCRGLYPSATDSGPYSQLCTTGRRPERQRHEKNCKTAKKSAEGENDNDVWLTWIREADKKAKVKRGLGKVWPPFIKWMVCMKINWPGMTKRSRIWAERWFAPAMTKLNIRLCVCMVTPPPLFKWFKHLIFTWTKESATRVVAALTVFRNLSRWVVQMQICRNTTRLYGDKVSSNTW